MSSSINGIRFFSCSNYAKDYRGTCSTRHYIRADSLEQVLLLELRRMTKLLADDEESFAAILAQKTGQLHQQERSHAAVELQKALVRLDELARLYERLYEDNVRGKVTDEWFLQLPHKYEEERLDLKTKTARLRQKLEEADSAELDQQRFLKAVRKFLEMDTLTAPLLSELVEKSSSTKPRKPAKTVPSALKSAIASWAIWISQRYPNAQFTRNISARAWSRRSLRPESIKNECS